FLFLSLACCGCQGKDADRLAALGAKLAHKAEGLFVSRDGTVMRGWGMKPLWGEASLENRVSARLSADKELTETSTQVQAVGGVIELHGKVQNMDQRRRAFELAQTTMGVEKVLDRLEIGP